MRAAERGLSLPGPRARGGSESPELVSVPCQAQPSTAPAPRGSSGRSLGAVLLWFYWSAVGIFRFLLHSGALNDIASHNKASDWVQFGFHVNPHMSHARK